jgi:hypothetical protein
MASSEPIELAKAKIGRSLISLSPLRRPKIRIILLQPQPQAFSSLLEVPAGFNSKVQVPSIYKATKGARIRLTAFLMPR